MGKERPAICSSTPTLSVRHCSVAHLSMRSIRSLPSTFKGERTETAMMDKPWKTKNRSFSSSVRLVHAGKRGRCGEVGVAL